MEIKYTRCTNCSLVYNQELKECPKCKQPLIITEDLNNTESVFNICDGE